MLGYPLLRKHTPLLAAFTQRYNGLRFFRANYVDGKLPATKSCLVTPEFCDKGLTIGFKIRIPNIEGYFEYKQYIFETEAVTVYFHLKNLVVLLRTTAPSKEWKVQYLQNTSVLESCLRFLLEHQILDFYKLRHIKASGWFFFMKTRSRNFWSVYIKG